MTLRLNNLGYNRQTDSDMSSFTDMLLHENDEKVAPVVDNEEDSGEHSSEPSKDSQEQPGEEVSPCLSFSLSTRDLGTCF